MREILMRGGVMESIHKLEKTVAGWYTNVPHLPVNIRKWLGLNAWWIVLIGVVLAVLSILPIIGGLLIIFGLSGVAIGAAGAYGSAIGGGVMGVVALSAIIAVAGFIATAVIMGLAISPLKAQAKKGWTLLFIVLIANVVIGVLSNLIAFSIVGIFFTLLWAAVEAYFLFEIRAEFGPRPVAKPAVKKEVTAKV